MNQRAKDGIKQFLEALSVDTEAPELEKTPSRVTELYSELFSGVGLDTKSAWGETFSTDYKGLVAVTGIPFYSMCEHHLLPFIGRAHIAYIPRDGRVIGLSKLSRVVDSFARRPQLQERLTSQIADFLDEQLDPLGVAVVIEAEHLCMTMRGARASGAQTRTSALRGTMRSDARARAEAISLLTK